MSLATSHNRDLRGERKTDWVKAHEKWLTHWGLRWQHLVQGHLSDDSSLSHEYWNWYSEFAMGLYLSPETLLQDPRQRELPRRQQHAQVPPQPPPHQHYAEMHPPPWQYPPHGNVPPAPWQYPPYGDMPPPPLQYPSYGDMPPAPWQYPLHGNIPPAPWQYPPYGNMSAAASHYPYMPPVHPQYSYGQIPPRRRMEPRRMSCSASSSGSTHGDEGQTQGRRSFDSGVHYVQGANSRSGRRSRAVESSRGHASTPHLPATQGDVYRPVPHVPQQEFSGLVPIVAENSEAFNELLMEVLQEPTATGDVGATSQYGGVVHEEEEEEEEEEAQEEEQEAHGEEQEAQEEQEEESSDRNRGNEGQGSERQGSEGQTPSQKSLLKRLKDSLREKIKLKKPNRFTPDDWRKQKRK